mgnify:FL=1
MLDIFVDADACPVKDEVLRVAERHGLAVFLVSNAGMRPSRNPLVRNIVVPPDPDAADDWIAGRIGPGDLCVTGDIPLAARCLERRALALHPNGKPYTGESIGMALAMRSLMQHLRETGEAKGGGAVFTPRDRSHFLHSLDETIRRLQREERGNERS